VLTANPKPTKKGKITMPEYTTGTQDVLPDGDYWFIVDDAGGKEPKTGKSMIELQLLCFSDDPKKTVRVFDRLVGGAMGQVAQRKSQECLPVLQSRAAIDDRQGQGQDCQYRVCRRHPYGVFRQRRLHDSRARRGGPHPAPRVGSYISSFLVQRVQ
jgi:hypothetical protein